MTADDPSRPCGLEGEAGVEVRQAEGVELRVSSAPLGWTGAELFAGSSGPCAISSDQTTGVPAHQLLVNRASEPLQFQTRDGRGFKTVELGPGQYWLGPADLPFEHHFARGLAFTRFGLQPEALDRLTGEHGARLIPAAGVDDPQLDLLVRALGAEVESGGPGGLAYSQSLITTLAHHLARRFGAAPKRQETVRGGLTPLQIKRVLELIDARLDQTVSLDEMAQVAGLSPFHFSRQFKRSTGASPHRFLLSRRLERARLLLEKPGAELGAVSQQVGFADQSHFTRWFRRQFGVTPGQVKRAAG